MASLANNNGGGRKKRKTKRKTKNGGKMDELKKQQVEAAAARREEQRLVAPDHAQIMRAMRAARPPTNRELIMNQRARLLHAKDEVKNHDYYVYQSPRDINMPPTRRTAGVGDHKHIGNTANAARGGPNSQRMLARRFGMDNTALIDLNEGMGKIRQLKWHHRRLRFNERALPNNQKTAKMQNGFRLYRDSPNDAWKSLGNYDFKDRDSGMHGIFRPHPQGVERELGRGGKRRRKTKRKRRKKTRKHKRRKRRKTRRR